MHSLGCSAAGGVAGAEETLVGAAIAVSGREVGAFVSCHELVVLRYSNGALTNYKKRSMTINRGGGILGPGECGEII